MQVNSFSSTWIVFFLLLRSFSPSRAGFAFSPQSRTELKRAVDSCLKLFPKGGCSNGLHGPMTEWDVSRVTDMNRLFHNAKSFNEDISKWDVSGVRDMTAMFQGATSFNRDISKWQVASVRNMNYMFQNAASFNQNLRGARWLHSKATKTDMFTGSSGSISSAVRGCRPTLLPRRAAFASTTALQSAVGNYVECEEALESLMSPKAHGTCATPVQKKLRWGCDPAVADDICCFNRHGAENAHYFESTEFYRNAANEMKQSGTNEITFYDSVTGKPLFIAPRGRTLEEFMEESRAHGWPSFRDEEVVKEHVRVLPDSGEAVSVDSTHLGHNIPDRNGNRYCINLVSVAGFPSKDAEKYDGGGRSRPTDLGWFPEI